MSLRNDNSNKNEEEYHGAYEEDSTLLGMDELNAYITDHLGRVPFNVNRIVFGGLTFWSTLLLSHIAVPISAASRLATPVGYISLLSASALTGVADFMFKQYTFHMSKNELEHQHYIASHISKYLIGCPVIYAYLGGYPYSIFPSDYSRIGAFRTHDGYIPATMSYADKHQRAIILKFGEQYGCHTCGTTRPTRLFIADHMPPLKHVKQYNQTFFRKYFPYITPARKQRFYPQCNDCSHLQSYAVNKNAKMLNYHMFSTLRTYHLSGAMVVIFNMIFETMNLSDPISKSNV